MKKIARESGNLLLWTGLSGLFFAACSQPAIQSYKVIQVKEKIPINADWEKRPWTEIPALELKYFMGTYPNHFPFVQAKMAYDTEAIYVIWRVEDQFVRAVAQKNQDHVFLDSCVEFFFIPGGTIDDGYLNLEMNCGGTLLFRHQDEGRKNVTNIDPADIAQIEIAHSLPKIVDPEIATPVTWYLEYRLPFSVIEKYSTLKKPASGVRWQANFYKCADQSSHPHWLTWSEVLHPEPSFHLPKYFGRLVFE